jgi:hypothetical protein
MVYQRWAKIKVNQQLINIALPLVITGGQCCCPPIQKISTSHNQVITNIDFP